MNNQIKLETERLWIRQPSLEDTAAVARLANNWNVAKNLGTMPHPYTFEDAEIWFEKQAREQGINAFGFGLYLKEEEGSFIGIMSVFNLVLVKPELGFWLGEPYWGRGLMSEAIIALRDFVFGELEAPFLLSVHLSENPASGRIAEKAGLSDAGQVLLWSRALRKFMPGRKLKLERVDWERMYA